MRKNLSKQFLLNSLSEDQLELNPLKQFKKWYDEVVVHKISEPEAMVLATSNKNAIPTSRVVLLKEFNESGFTFFTNYYSKKGKDLTENPHASLLFFWKELERQVRIEGIAEKLSPNDSKYYFDSRPLESRLGAIVSNQSEVIPDWQYLEDKFKAVEENSKSNSLEMPIYWGGFLVVPYKFEFWQGRKNRLHDRLCYEKDGDSWRIYRLSP